MRYYGKLSIKSEDNAWSKIIKSESKVKERIHITGFEPTLYISRLISDSYSPAKGELRVDANIHNAKLIDMVMSKYPLEILDQDKEKWQKLLNQLQHSESIGDKIANLDFAEPNKSTFLGTLKPFQKQGLDFFDKTEGNSLLADEMGLGKTVQTLAFLTTRQDSFPVVVIAPLVTLRNWESEIKKFMKIQCTTDLMKGFFLTPTTTVIRTGKNEKLPISNFYIINYELLGKRADDIIRLKPRTLVYDEVQNLRSIKTGKFQAVRYLSEIPSVNYRIGLSGTPIYNRGSEIWGIVDLLRKGLLGSYEDFKKTYCTGFGDRFVVTQDSQKVLAKVLRDNIMLRRLKKDVLDDLPPKIRYQQIIQIDEEYYEREISKIYEKIEIAKKELNSITDDEIALNKTQNIDIVKTKIMELNAEGRKSLQEERQVAGISKAPYIVEYVKDLLENTGDEEKFVIFVHHHSVHEIIMNGLQQFRPLQIIGTMNDVQRNDNVQKFQNDPNRKIIVCGLRAGNVGINLTAGTYVIFGELDWSPPVHKQAEDRLHRIGQKKTVIAHYLIGESTSDEIVASVLTDKAMEIDAVMGDKREEADNQKAYETLEALYKKHHSKSKISEMVSQSEGLNY